MTHSTFELSKVNKALLDVRDAALFDTAVLDGMFYYWRPCRVRVLVVTDEALSFNPASGFGLSAFVSTLLEPSFFVRFEITLAHITSFTASDPAMMPGDGRIANRIGGFKFDNAAHFAPANFDVVFLFGFANNTYSRGGNYPSDSLSDAELQKLAEFQNGGGGLFATGDHGSLGRALCHKVPRARNMRLWQSTNNQLGEDMVSMLGRYRNDSNVLGHDGVWQFEDQSDDIPQTISPKFYSRNSGIFRYSFPHPVLCGPNGPIRVMPDHPHEGECRTPADPNLQLNFTSAAGPEYPPATDGGIRPLPEIISYNHVPSGSGGLGPTGRKLSSVAQSFPGLAAYDGHRAGIGRVITDATWHHFVNVNLTGDTSFPVGHPKRIGFLASASGEAHLEEIKAFYRNLAIWLSPSARISCMNAHLLWHVVFIDQVNESVLTARGIGLDRVSPYVLAMLGRHARDVLGRYAGRCQSLRIILDIIEWRVELIPEIDPWFPRLPEPEPPFERVEDLDLPLIDGTPILETALGGALVRISEAFGDLNPKKRDSLEPEAVLKVAREGAAIAMKRAGGSIEKAFETAKAMLLQESAGSQDEGSA